MEKLVKLLKSVERPSIGINEMKLLNRIEQGIRRRKVVDWVWSAWRLQRAYALMHFVSAPYGSRRALRRL